MPREQKSLKGFDEAFQMKICTGVHSIDSIIDVHGIWPILLLI